MHFLMSIGNRACTKSKRDGHARAGREGERERERGSVEKKKEEETRVV